MSGGEHPAELRRYIDLVRDGYERVATAYHSIRATDVADLALLAGFADLLPDGARVLDAGCGSGVPAARYLSAERGFTVVGVDIAAAQVELARKEVPRARFIQADMTRLGPPEFVHGSFDGICSLYAVIHVPRGEHPALLATFRRLLRPGGLLLLTTGHDECADVVEADWLGAPMYWSHYGREENLRMLVGAGFDRVWEKDVREHDAFGGGRHLFILVRAPYE
jgi:SAM-dependent methyltransferase